MSKERWILFHTSQGTEVRANVLRLTRHQVVFEVYNPVSHLRVSEVLSEVKIFFNEGTVYFGKAVVSSLVNTGLMLVYEAALGEGWLDVDLSTGGLCGAKMGEEFHRFLLSWEKNYRIRPEYKSLIADMQVFLMDLQRWLEQVELGIRSSPSADRGQLEQEVARALGPEICQCIDAIWERFEPIVKNLAPEEQPAHRAYLRRQLHPLLLCSPFAYRAFSKPLGYTGDYELVNMILRDPHEGSSLFAKMINHWLLQQPPAKAHRNRAQYLTEKLVEEIIRHHRQNYPVRIFSLGCGPAVEVQQLLRDHELSDRAHLVLLDFDDETLQHASARLHEIQTTHHRTASVQLVKKSVQQLLKEASKSIERPAEQLDNFIYCAGLFDYLSNPVCQRLLSLLYNRLAPGGLLLATNVDSSKPFHISMEYMLEWHLICRNGQQLAELAPPQGSPNAVSVETDLTGVNVFLQIRKPANG